jgi:hypothetical protein
LRWRSSSAVVLLGAPESAARRIRRSSSHALQAVTTPTTSLYMYDEMTHNRFATQQLYGAFFICFINNLSNRKNGFSFSQQYR